MHCNGQFKRYLGDSVPGAPPPGGPRSKMVSAGLAFMAHCP